MPTTHIVTQTGFVYIWFDTKRKMFYIGSHMGKENDGYIAGGNKGRFFNVFKKRPSTMKRRIIYRYYGKDRRQLYDEEQRWLDMIKPEEFGTKFYNSSRKAHGPSVMNRKRKPHSEQTKEKIRQAHIGITRRSGYKIYVTESHKINRLMARRNRPLREVLVDNIPYENRFAAMSALQISVATYTRWKQKGRIQWA